MKLPALPPKLASLFKRKTAAERLAEKNAAKAPAEPAAPKRPLIDFQQLAMDFKTLDPKDPGLWPLAPRIVILLSLFVGLIAAAWGFGAIGWSVQLEELESKKQQEAKHKEDWLSTAARCAPGRLACAHPPGRSSWSARNPPRFVQRIAAESGPVLP